MITGSITLNGITDENLIHILEFKSKNPGVFVFNPQTMKSGLRSSPGNPGMANVQAYSDVTLGWNDARGLKIVQDILHKMQPHTPV